MQGYKQVVSRIPYDLWVKMKEIAIHRGTSLNKIVIDSLESERKKLQKKVDSK